MNLKFFLQLDRVLLGFFADNQKNALEKLIAPLVNAGVVSDSETLLDDLMRREGEITTVMENGVAIPHARSRAVNRLGLVVGLTDEDGVQFKEESDVRTRLFFCIAIPTFAPTSHIPLLQVLADFSRDSRRIKKLLNFKTAAGVSRYLNAFKG